MEFFKFEGGKESISLDELGEICLRANQPSDLIQLIDDFGLNLGFAERLSFMWRKPFDEYVDEEVLNKTVQKGLEVDLKYL